jgi:iron complex transport system ATP-binding protein
VVLIGLDGVMTVDDPGRASTPAPWAGFAVNEDAVLQMQDVTVQRGAKILLDSIDWTVELDERWVVLGANGAGKTTLLQIAAAQLHPTDGIVYVLGERLGAVDLFELRPRIGLTSAALAQRIPNRELVGDIVISAGYSVVGRWREAYGRADRRRATRILTQLGVADLRERQFGTLSEGERKRVQIARALMTDPELLLLDEPAAGMDLGGREDLLRRLTRLARRADAPASVLVTHHVEEIPVGTTHALLLRDGMVVASGLIRDTLTDESLTETFDLPVLLERVAGRYYARAAPRTRKAAIDPKT